MNWWQSLCLLTLTIIVMHRLMKIGAAKHQDIWQMISARITWHKWEIFAATLWKQAVAAANWELGPCSRSTGSRVAFWRNMVWWAADGCPAVCIRRRFWITDAHGVAYTYTGTTWQGFTRLPTAGLYLGTKDSIEDLNTNFKVKEHKSQIVKALYWICFFGPGGLWKWLQCINLALFCWSRKQPWWSLKKQSFSMRTAGI